MALMGSCEQDKKICVPDFCLTISEYLSVQICFICTIMEKEKMCFWGYFQMQRITYLIKMGFSYPHTRGPRGRVVSRLVKLVAQTHGLLALQSSDVPPDSHKMAVATPDITSSFTYGQMLQCLSPFHREKDLS